MKNDVHIIIIFIVPNTHGYKKNKTLSYNKIIIVHNTDKQSYSLHFQQYAVLLHCINAKFTATELLTLELLMYCTHLGPAKVVSLTNVSNEQHQLV